MNNKTEISAAIIAYNAENTIVNCLNSIKDYCSEIIIALDTKTTDETRQRIIDFARDNNPDDIHRGLEDNGKQIGKIKLYDYKWLNDSFSDARNFTLSKVTGDWILWIDTDEVLFNHVQPSNNYDYYTVDVRDFNKGVLSSILPTPKLFKNNLGIKFIRSTHEEVWTALEGKKGFRSAMYTNHKEKSDEKINERVEYLLKRAYKELNTEPWNELLFGQIGTYLQQQGKWAESLKWLHRAMFKNIQNNIKAQIATRIFVAYQMLDNTDCDNAMYWLHLSCALCPVQLSARYTLYQIYHNDGQIDEAQKQKILLKQIGNNSNLPFDIPFAQINFKE